MRSIQVAVCLLLASGCASPAALRPVAPSQPRTVSAASPAPTHPRVPAQSARALGVEAVAGEFVAFLQNHKFPQAVQNFDRAMNASLPVDSLESAWASVERGAGRMLRVELFESIPRPPRTHVWFACDFERRSWNVEVVVDAAHKVSGLRLQPVPPAWTAPDYADRAAISERPVKVGAPPWSLDGVLTEPGNPSGFAVVLVHGSGPQDEDASVGPRGAGNKMFKDLAWGLATQGVAVLRYPKRTWAHPDQFVGVAYTLDDEVTRDACLAVQEAAAQTGVRTDHVFVVAHSLGAALAPRIAAACPALGGVVMLAGPARSIDLVLFDQFQYLLALAGKNRSEVASEMGELLAGFSTALSLSSASDEQMSFSGMRAPLSYWADVTGYDPAAAMKRAPKVPMLVMQGGRDYQVRPSEFEAWKRVLRSRPEAVFKLYPSLDHRFVAGEGLPTPADYARPGHVARDVIIDVAAWIKHTHR